MLIQQKMIERTRQLCLADERVIASMLYGSFSQALGDKYSDIEFILYFKDEVLEQVEQQAWVSQIAPVALYFADDSGHHTAIFENLIRGEFHFEPATKMASISSWQGNAWFPSLDTAVLVDRTGELTSKLQPLQDLPLNKPTTGDIESLVYNLLNWFLFGVNVLARGEAARALDLLGNCHWPLLMLVRVHEGRSEFRPTPSRLLEHEISEAAYQQFKKCTADLDQAALWQAYRSLWDWMQMLITSLKQQHQLTLPETLLANLDGYIQKTKAQFK